MSNDDRNKILRKDAIVFSFVTFSLGWFLSYMVFASGMIFK